MAKYTFKYGNGTVDFEYPEEDVIKVIEPAPLEKSEKTEEQIIREAIENPIGSPKLEEIVKPGQSVCIVVPDVTRLWARPSVIVHILVEKLEKIGVKDEDILFISGVGTHRLQEEEDFENLIGKDFCARFRHQNHYCDSDDFVTVGTTSRGNEIQVNKFAMECDHRILVGGIVFHFLAGFGGGRKMVLPGISSRTTINTDHKYYFKPGPAGSGAVDTVACGITDGNPIHEDMLEAAKMAKISFIVNSVVDRTNTIAKCFAGDLELAHKEGYEFVKKLDGVKLEEKADLVIASACGYPKDINFYQTGAKTLFNAIGAAKPGEGVVIIVSQCSEGWGNPDTEKFAMEFDNMLDREVFLRDNFGIGRYVGYRIFEVATQVHFIIVSDMDPAGFSKTDIIPCKTIEEAIAKAHEITGKEKMSTYIMPFGANTMASTDI